MRLRGSRSGVRGVEIGGAVRVSAANSSKNYAELVSLSGLDGPGSAIAIPACNAILMKRRFRIVKDHFSKVLSSQGGTSAQAEQSQLSYRD